MRMPAVIISAVLALSIGIGAPVASQPVEGCTGHDRQGDWTAVALPEEDGVYPPTVAGAMGVAVDPSDADVLFVWSVGAVFRSADQGCTWERVFEPTAPATGPTRVEEVAVGPVGSQTVLVRVSEASAFLPNVVYRSTDAGTTFDEGRPLPSAGVSNQLSFAGPQEPDVVVTVSNDLLLGQIAVDVSTDDGQTWENRSVFSGGEGDGSQPRRAQELRVAVDPHDADVVWLKDSQKPAAVYRSTDGARTFAPTGLEITPDERVSYGDDGVAVTALPGGGTRVTVSEEYDSDTAATDQSLRYVSDDGGATFVLEPVPTTPFSVREHITGINPDDEMVTARHFFPSSTPGTVVLRRDHQQGWMDVSLPDLGHLEQLQSATDPMSGRTVAWGLGEGQLWRYDGPIDRPLDGEVGLRRLAGPERITTGIAVSADGFTGSGSAATVVLARADDFPDALAGSPLAVATGGPVLLTSADGLSPETAAELQRALPAGSSVRLLGGRAALSEQVATDVVALGYQVQRVAGPSRFETAVAIAETTTTTPAVILLADGTTFADALIAGAAAAAVGGTVVLTAGEQQHPATAAYLEGHPDTVVVAVGAVAGAAAPEVQQVGGEDPVATAVAVAQRFASNPDRVALASAAAFPDGLTGGAHAGAAGMPLLLTPPDGLEPVTAEYLASLRGIREVVVYGGTAAITDGVTRAAVAASAVRSGG